MEISCTCGICFCLSLSNMCGQWVQASLLSFKLLLDKVFQLIMVVFNVIVCLSCVEDCLFHSFAFHFFFLHFFGSFVPENMLCNDCFLIFLIGCTNEGVGEHSRSYVLRVRVALNMCCISKGWNYRCLLMIKYAFHDWEWAFHLGNWI